MTKLMLVKPEKKYMESFLEACKQHKEYGIGTFPLPDPQKYHEWKDTLLEEYEKYHLGIDLPNNYVSATTFWLIEDEEWIGLGNIRHSLTPALEKLGGHIGYAIKHSKWNQGYGTIQLQLLLEEAKKLKISKALITCNAENTASARVMEKNGAVLQDEISLEVEGSMRQIKRYWVTLEEGTTKDSDPS